MYRFTISALLMLATAGSALAASDSVRAEYSHMAPGYKVVSIAGHGSVYAGFSQFVADKSHPDTQGLGLELDDVFGAYCIDINQAINFNYTGTWNIEPLPSAPIPGVGMGPVKAELLRRLWNDHFEASAAFQVAVWEIVNEYDLGYLNVTSGDFRLNWGLNSAQRTKVHGWFDAITDPGYGTQIDTRDFALTSSGTQDFMIVLPPEEQSVIPEPITMVGLAMSAAAAGGYLRRRRAA